MRRWLRKLLGCDCESKPVVIKFEVTVNVAPIHVLTSGPKEGEKPRVVAENRPELQSTEKRITSGNFSETSEECLARIALKSRSTPVPEVPFGEERRT